MKFVRACLSVCLLTTPLSLHAQGPDSKPGTQQEPDLGDIVKAKDIFAHVTKDKGYVTLETKSKDGLPLTADIYPGASASAPMILLFHQAGSSRGEYRKIAPRLRAKGYNCLALDARSGNGVRWGVTNVTSAHALRRKLDRSYLAARQDLERSVAWVREMQFTGPLVIWGSSYSAALVLLMAQPDADGKKIHGVLAFSPGEYLGKKGLVTRAVPRIQVPIFMTCARAEAKRTLAPFVKLMKNPQSGFFLPNTGRHGSSILTMTQAKEQAMRKDASETWTRVFGFLALVAPTKANPAPRADTRPAAPTPKPTSKPASQAASRRGRD